MLEWEEKLAGEMDVPVWVSVCDWFDCWCGSVMKDRMWGESMGSFILELLSHCLCRKLPLVFEESSTSVIPPRHGFFALETPGREGRHSQSDTR